MVYALFFAKKVQCSMSNVHFFVTLHPENEKRIIIIKNERKL